MKRLLTAMTALSVLTAGVASAAPAFTDRPGVHLHFFKPQPVVPTKWRKRPFMVRPQYVHVKPHQVRRTCIRLSKEKGLHYSNGFPRPTLGCAIHDDWWDYCIIVLPSKPVRTGRGLKQIVYKIADIKEHEDAHCKGWFH